jgi:3-hydroxyacyl-[acyl-carrier-protein] dehydratase
MPKPPNYEDMESPEMMEKILQLVPQQPPFRFIETIDYLDHDRIEGSYTLKETADFYQGHFPGFPVTPGAILMEIMAQTGMVAFGIYLMMLEGEKEFKNMSALLTQTHIRFKKQVAPGERVFIRSEKTVFRYGKLECRITLKDAKKDLICFGEMGGMLLVRK